MLALCRICVLSSAALLGLGLVAPCMTISPGYGRYDAWVRLLDPSLTRASEYSILTGILTLLQQGHTGIGLLLLFFSCVFPTLKLALTAWAMQLHIEGRDSSRWWVGVMHHVGKFSMLDILVIAMIVIAIKGLPGSTEVRLGWGVWAFAGSVVLAMLAAMMLHHMTTPKVSRSPGAG